MRGSGAGSRPRALDSAMGHRLAVAGTENDLAAMQPFVARRRSSTGGEVVELRHRARGRREVALGDWPRASSIAVQHVPFSRKHPRERPRRAVAKERESRRIVELVAVDAEAHVSRPGVAPRGRDASLPRRSSAQPSTWSSSRARRRRISGRPVGRDMVDGVDPVAERRDVADRLLDEDVLVVHEDDARPPALRARSPRSSSRAAAGRPRATGP